MHVDAFLHSAEGVPEHCSAWTTRDSRDDRDASPVGSHVTAV